MTGELYINDDKILIDGVFLGSQITNIGELRIKTSVTNQFKIDKTNENCKIFGFIDDINSASTLPYTVSDSRLKVGGVEAIHKGQLVINKVDEFFHVIIREGNSNFFNELTGTLRDLDLSSHNFVWTLTNVIAARTNTNSWNFLIQDWGLQSGTYDFDIRYALPSIPLYIVMNQIWTEAGWTKSGDFFSASPYTEQFISCVNRNITAAILSNTQSQMAKSGNTTFSGATLAGGIPFNSTVSDVYGLMSNFTPDQGETATKYTVPSEGSYTFEFVIDYDVSSGSTANMTLTMRHYRAAGQIASDSFNYSGGDKVDSETMTWTRDCETEDVIYITATVSAATTLLVLVGSTYEITDIQGITSGLGLGFDIAANMPNMLQKDLVEAVAGAYGLLFNPNPLTKNIAVSKYEDFDTKKTEGDYVDWSSTLKLKDISNIPKSFRNKRYAQRNYFNYLEDETVPSGLGDSYFDIADINLNTETIKITLPFAASESRTLYSLIVPIIKSWGEDNDGEKEFAERKPRWFIYENKASAIRIDYTDGTDTTPTSTDIPSCYFIDSDQATDLGWENLLSDNYTVLQALLTSYKDILVPLDLNMSEFSQIDHTKPFFIKFLGWLILEKVNRFNENGLTKCKMIRM